MKGLGVGPCGLTCVRTLATILPGAHVSAFQSLNACQVASCSVMQRGDLWQSRSYRRTWTRPFSALPTQALDRWEDRLEALFEGRPYDVLDAALTDTVSRYPVHIQPFRDMIDGMRMDLVKSRYRSYDELYGYCYKVAGTVALMTTPVMGIDPAYPVRWLRHAPG